MLDFTEIADNCFLVSAEQLWLQHLGELSCSPLLSCQLPLASCPASNLQHRCMS